MKKEKNFTTTSNNGSNKEDASKAKNDNRENGFQTNNSVQNAPENKLPGSKLTGY